MKRVLVELNLELRLALNNYYNSILTYFYKLGTDTVNGEQVRFEKAHFLSFSKCPRNRIQGHKHTGSQK